MVHVAAEIVPSDVRRSAISSKSIGAHELEAVLTAVPAHAGASAYRNAIVVDNVLGLATHAGRSWRYKTLRRLYRMDPESLLFRALRDLWDVTPTARPVLACLMAMANDTVFRATAEVIVELPYGQTVTTNAFVARLDEVFPGAYSESTASAVAGKASMSWEQTGHLTGVRPGVRERMPAACEPGNVAYALLLGHLQDLRGQALFDTVWTSVLDRPRSQLVELATMASQQGMLEFRSAGGVVEVGFSKLLRPLEGQLL